MTSDPLASPDTPSDTPPPAPPDTSKPAKNSSDKKSSEKPAKPADTSAKPHSPAPKGAGAAPEDAVKFTRAAALWGSLIFGFLILIVLLIFIAQNTESAEFAFFNLRWSLPLGVAILFAAVAGGLLTVAVGAVRIFQLRRAAKKNLKAGL